MVELILYDRYFFNSFLKNHYLLVNLGSYILNINNRPIVSKMFHWQNNQKIIKEIKVPYSDYNWNFKKFSTNKLVVLHFRRGDYIIQLFSNLKNPRTMCTFDNTIDKLTKKLNNEQKLDIVIISDHYDKNKISDNNKKYIPILFDYEKYNIDDKIEKNNITLIVRDKVLGTDADSNYNTLKYLSNCDYSIGNMSCLPSIIARVFKNNKIKFLTPLTPNIINLNSVINLYNSK